MDGLRQAVMEAMQLYGAHGWATEDGERSNSYVGFSLTYNPEHEEGVDIHASSLGSSKVSRESYFAHEKILKIKHTDPERGEAGWHRDEPVFVHLRVNAPVFTDPSFRMQIEDSVDEFLEAGKLYSWDTDIPHRPVATQETDRVRVHLVLGFSPWLDYVEEEEAYVLNEFYGRMHPFDMLNEGLIFPRARIAQAA